MKLFGPAIPISHCFSYSSSSIPIRLWLWIKNFFGHGYILMKIRRIFISQLQHFQKFILIFMIFNALVSWSHFVIGIFSYNKNVAVKSCRIDRSVIKSGLSDSLRHASFDDPLDILHTAACYLLELDTISAFFCLTLKVMPSILKNQFTKMHLE